jgi:hypothetical protein
MERFRLGRLVVLSLALVLLTSPSVRSDEANSQKPLVRPPAPPQHPFARPRLVPDITARDVFYKPVQSAESDVTCQIYPLGEWSNDPNLGKWIADTIPEVIQPGTWSTSGGKNVLKYYAPAGILVVCHTPAAQAQVDAFLKNVKKSVQQKQATMANYLTKMSNNTPRNSVLVPAKYAPADQVKEGTTPNKSTSYPVPAQAQQPKHLFHFIIRYEGEGIIDSTVAGVLKQLYGAEESEDEQPAKKKKKKKSKQEADDQTSVPALDQLFHLIVRYEGEGIIDSTVADVLKTLYAGSNPGAPTCVPATGTSPQTLPSVPSSVPVPVTPQTIRPPQAAPAPTAPKPAETSSSY